MWPVLSKNTTWIERVKPPSSHANTNPESVAAIAAPKFPVAADKILAVVEPRGSVIVTPSARDAIAHRDRLHARPPDCAPIATGSRRTFRSLLTNSAYPVKPSFQVRRKPSDVGAAFAEYKPMPVRRITAASRFGFPSRSTGVATSCFVPYGNDGNGSVCKVNAMNESPDGTRETSDASAHAS